MKRSLILSGVSGLVFAALSLLLFASPRMAAQLPNSSATLRLKAARALAEAGDAEAVRILIDLLAELPAEERRSVEEYLTALAGEWAPKFSSRSNERMAGKLRRTAWLAWWDETDGDFLLAIIRKHRLTSPVRRQVQRLIGKLGDDDFAVREAAGEELRRLGRLALPQLREAVSDQDLERARRVRDVVAAIEKEPPSPRFPEPTLRLLALRRPPGAAEALLEHYPLAEEEEWRDEVRQTLARLARRGDRLDAALVRGLGDELPQVRIAAAEALVMGGGRLGVAAVRKMLREDAPPVRLHVALALTRAGEKEGVSALIELLAVLSESEVGAAEEALYQIAGESSPETPLGGTADDRKKCRDAWAAWWKDNAAQVDLGRLTREPVLGYTLICDANAVVEVDRQGKRRWSIDGLNSPTDARMLPGRRLLIAECGARRVLERDLKGNIFWQKSGLKAYAANVQRLSNGNTFIAERDGAITEVDRAGKDVYQITNIRRLLSGHRSRNGIICVTEEQRCLFLDTTGKELRGFDVKYPINHTGCLDVRADGRILIASYPRGKVMEYDTRGKLLREWSIPGVDTATGLSNGHILACSRYGSRLVEMDRDGKVVWEQRGYHAYRARRR